MKEVRYERIYVEDEEVEGETMKKIKKNYIFISTNGKILNLDQFKRNILMPIAFLLGVAVFFATTWFMFLLAYAFQG